MNWREGVWEGIMLVAREAGSEAGREPEKSRSDEALSVVNLW